MRIRINEVRISEDALYYGHVPTHKTNALVIMHSLHVCVEKASTRDVLFKIQHRVNLSIISPRNLPVLRSIFELGQPSEELDKEVMESANHAILPRHLVLFQGFEIPGKP